ncbi:MAG: hypothetical protein NT117_03780 [Gammaproteobacteria bacterium]|nr:hypothetical protein [Gammaproteobacteria bacterium]
MLISLLAITGFGIASEAGATSPATTKAGAATAPAKAPGWPATPEEIRTTSGDIYLGNLDARIDALAIANGRTPRVDLQASQAGALYHRYRIRGTLADAEAALALLDAALTQAPGNAEARALRATVLAGFHRFTAASADLDAVAALQPAKANALADARREISLATGRYDQLREEFSNSANPDGPFYELAFRGNLLLQRGDLAGASAQFRRAQALFTDSSPMPLAWLHVQQGIALLRHGRHAEAAVFFKAAHDRLPGFTLATEHLAETQARLGNHALARELYEKVIADTGSPEFIAALARVERDAGNAALSAELYQRAQAGWSRLVAKYPAAFAQHAIGFYLDRGDSARALELARQNIILRQDVGSYILLALAADAAGSHAEACTARQSAMDSGLDPPEMGDLAALGTSCRQKASSGLTQLL